MSEQTEKEKRKRGEKIEKKKRTRKKERSPKEGSNFSSGISATEFENRRASEVNRHRHEYLGGDESPDTEARKEEFVGECRSLGSPPIMRTSHLESNVYIRTASFKNPVPPSRGSFSSMRSTGGPPNREIRGKVGFNRSVPTERLDLAHVCTGRFENGVAIFEGDRIISVLRGWDADGK